MAVQTTPRQAIHQARPPGDFDWGTALQHQAWWHRGDTLPITICSSPQSSVVYTVLSLLQHLEETRLNAYCVLLIRCECYIILYCYIAIYKMFLRLSTCNISWRQCQCQWWSRFEERGLALLPLNLLIQTSCFVVIIANKYRLWLYPCLPPTRVKKLFILDSSVLSFTPRKAPAVTLSPVSRQ